MITANSPVTDLMGVGPKVADCFERLGITTAKELAEYLPVRLEDRSQIRAVSSLVSGEDVVISGTITAAHQRQSKRGLTIVQVTLEDETGKIPVLWFNQRYLLQQLRPGQQLMVFGAKRPAPSLGNPFFAKKIITEAGIVPIYRTTKGLSQAMLGKIIAQAAEALRKEPALVPGEFNDKGETLVRCHQKSTPEHLEAARSLLAEEELLVLGLTMASEPDGSARAKVCPADKAWLQTMTEALPYRLTDGQRRAAWEIINDLDTKKPMRRVMYGEVGSGKTIVSLLAAATTIKAGGKVAILVPTTTLADQQTAVARKILSPHGLTVAQRTSSHRDHIDGADVVIGTHALLQKSITLGVDLIIVDEQQRFGVAERQYLLERNPNAHLLLMTATPIPRSLAHIIFGKMQLTYLRGRPAHQQKITTQVFTDAEREAVMREIGQRLKRGEPGYVICPLIEAADDEMIENYLASERKTVEKEAKRFKEAFPAAAVAVIHGRLKADQKEKILTGFKSGEVDILVATTVVEVGIDNPEASWILVEEADRFGLAQLHQLRGRVGRGSAASVCFLSRRDGISPYGVKRLEAIQQLQDGLELAEVDLGLRGPGDLIGLEQSGLPRLKYANWQDIGKIKKMFALAEKIVHDGIEQYPLLAAERDKYEQKITFG